MIHALVPQDAPAMVRLWRSFYPAKYWIDAALIQSHFFDSGAVVAGVGLFEGNDLLAFVTAKTLPDGYENTNPTQLKLQSLAFTHPQHGASVLTELLSHIPGFTSLIFGTDNRHFFPGVPLECERLAAFLRSSGFQVGEGLACDLERDLSNYEVPEGVSVHHNGVELRVCEERDRSAVPEFFLREFPQRWRYDVMSKWDIEGPQTVFGMFEKGKCEGFALIQSEPCQLPIGGAVWKHDLGENWGSLGPIGVSQGVRGRGLGHAVLAAALLELKQRGCRQTIIDWTTLRDFYGRHGFAVNREYQTFVLNL